MPRAPSVKEGAERVVTSVWLCRSVHKDTIGTDAMLKAEELPAGISSLHTSLAHMNGDALSLDDKNKTKQMEVKNKARLLNLKSNWNKQ